MTLKEFRNHIESFPKGTTFRIGISYPTAWVQYSKKVAFSIIDKPHSRESVLKNIYHALTEEFNFPSGSRESFGLETEIVFQSPTAKMRQANIVDLFSDYNKPRPLPEIDFSDVLKLASDYIDFVGSGNYNDDEASDYEDHIHNAVLSAIYGDGVWDFIEKNQN